MKPSMRNLMNSRDMSYEEADDYMSDWYDQKYHEEKDREVEKYFAAKDKEVRRETRD